MAKFFEIPPLSDGVITLKVEEYSKMRPGEWAPSYKFLSYVGEENVGHIHLRIGMNDDVYYGGHIGYGVRRQHRGKGYALRACLLLPQVARAHDMDEIIITCTPDNIASIRTIEKSGALFEGVAPIPKWSELRDRGIKHVNRYVWDVSRYKAGVYPIREGYEF